MENNSYVQTALDLRNRTDIHTAKLLRAYRFRTRGPTQRENCWEIGDKMAMLDTALRGFHCGPIYVIRNHEEKIDDVFDGAHRCESVFDFIDNKYPITKGKKDTINWETSPLKEYVGKTFEHIPVAVQNKFTEYKFFINIIDEDTANDPHARGLLWERLSKAGKPLNTFETKTQTHTLLYKNVLGPNVHFWTETAIFQKKVSKRGQVESLLMKLLALSEKESLPSFNSQEDLISKWCDDVLGKTTEDIDKNTNEKADALIARIKHMRNIMKELQDKKILHKEDGTYLVDTSKEIPLLLALGRLGFWFPTISSLKRVLDDVCKVISDILKMNTAELCKYLGVPSRNALYQKKLIIEFDTKFKPLAEKSQERRCFSAAEKKKKLDEQGNICPLCNKTIEEYQRIAGDHVVEWSRGGPTTLENCQIVHRLCHEQKNMG